MKANFFRYFAISFIFYLAMGHYATGQSDSIFCEKVLSKNELSDQDFEQLDSALFSMNYYISEAPLKFYHRARKKALAQNNIKQAAQAEIMMADLFHELDIRDSSTYYGNLAAKRLFEIKDEAGYARTANIRRINYTATSQFDKAYEICFEALDILLKNEDVVGASITYRDIGSIMMLEKKYKEAIDYCLKALPGLEAVNHWYELNFSYQRVAIGYKNLRKFDLAHAYIQKAADACKQLKGFRVQQGLAKIVWTRGYIFEAQEMYEEAVMDYDSSKVLAGKIGYDILDRTIYNSKGEIFLKQKQYEQALVQFQKSQEFIARKGITQQAYDYYVPIYANMIQAFEGLGEYKKANEYLTKLSAAKDSIFAIASEKQKIELQTKYETAQKEAMISSLNRDKRNQQRFLILGGILLASLGLLAFLLWRNIRYRIQANAKLNEQKTEIEKKNLQNETLLKEIHHRVKNNLQTISSLLSLQSETIDDKAAFDAVQESKNRVTSMALIHQKLYQGENLASIEMREYFRIMGDAVIDSFGGKADGIELDIAMDAVEMDVDVAIPIGLITNELLTNSMKYAFPNRKGKITIGLKKMDNELYELHISDNGIGQESKNKKEETGFGSLLIQLLTAQLRGNIDISTKNGTAAILRFPQSYKSAV